MPAELFIVPMVGAGTREDPIRPRYRFDEFGGAFGIPTAGGGASYSDSAVAVMWLNAPQAYLDEVAAQPDADRLCAYAELADNIGGQANTRVRNLLESLNIPGQWTSASLSWRQILRTLINMFHFTRKHEDLNGVGFFADLDASGFDLNTQWQNLSPAFQSSIQGLIDDFGWAITPAPTQQVRSLLKEFADQFEGTVYETSIGPI